MAAAQPAHDLEEAAASSRLILVRLQWQAATDNAAPAVLQSPTLENRIVQRRLTKGYQRASTRSDIA